MTNHSHVTLRLDTGAVQSLFADPEAKLELQRAVIAEVCKKMFNNYVPSVMNNLIVSVFETHKQTLVAAIREDTAMKKSFEAKFEEALVKVEKGALRTGSVTLSPAVQKKVGDLIQSSVSTFMQEKGVTVSNMVKAAADLAFEKFKEQNGDRISALIAAKTEAYVNGEVQRRLDEMSKAWRL